MMCKDLPPQNWSSLFPFSTGFSISMSAGCTKHVTHFEKNMAGCTKAAERVGHCPTCPLCNSVRKTENRDTELKTLTEGIFQLIFNSYQISCNVPVPSIHARMFYNISELFPPFILRILAFIITWSTFYCWDLGKRKGLKL